MIVVLDNYDSFVYNLVQYLGEIGEAVIVVRNDRVNIDAIMRAPPSAIIVSPGPGVPRNAGKSCELIDASAGRIPVFGVCLGLQSIAAVYGGSVIRADRVVHGKVSWIHHDGSALYRGIDTPFEATRYHSLIVDRATLPSCLRVTAWTDDGTVMGLQHIDFNIHGVQYHPESILTACGKRVIRNFLKGAASEHHPIQ